GRTEAEWKQPAGDWLEPLAERFVNAAASFGGQKPARAVGSFANAEQGVPGNRLEWVRRSAFSVAVPQLCARLPDRFGFFPRDRNCRPMTAAPALRAREPLLGRQQKGVQDRPQMSFMAQRIDRFEAGGLDGRIDADDQADRKRDEQTQYRRSHRDVR